MFASFFDAKHLPHVGFGKASFFLSQNYKERIPIGKSWPLDSLDSHGRVRLKSDSSWPEMLSRGGSIVSKALPGKHQHAAKLECHPQAAHPKERTCSAGSNNGVWSVQHCRELVYSTAECFRRPATCWPASSWDTTSSFLPCLLACLLLCLGVWGNGRFEASGICAKSKSKITELAAFDRYFRYCQEFVRDCEIWLKLWNLVGIVKFGWNCDIL